MDMPAIYTIKLTLPELAVAQEGAIEIERLAGVADGEDYDGLSLHEADVARAEWETELAEIFLNALARAGLLEE